MIGQWQSIEPRYQGKRLGVLLKGDPIEYVPAMMAIRTNALPYLLQEIQARDSGLSRLGIGLFHRWLEQSAALEDGAGSEASRPHRAGRARQQRGACLVEHGLFQAAAGAGWGTELEAVLILAEFPSGAARIPTRRAVVEALDSGDAVRQWNASWIVALGGATLDTNLLE